MTCGESQCTCVSIAAGRDDHAGGVEDRGADVEHDVDAVHRVRVARAADATIAPVGHADRRVADAEDRVEDQAADDRGVDAAPFRAHAEAVAHRVAEAGDELVGAVDVVALGDDVQRRVAEADGRGGQAPR